MMPQKVHNFTKINPHSIHENAILIKDSIGVDKPFPVLYAIKGVLGFLLGGQHKWRFPIPHGKLFH
jgi:hypothetical protein